MPIIMNNGTEQKALDSIKMNNQEIDKIYMGENLVYNHDAPVYMIRLYKGFVYSYDGIHYNIATQYSSGENWHGGVGYTKNKLLFGRDNGGKSQIVWFNPKRVRKGNLGWSYINPGVGNYQVWGLSTDGENTIVCGSNYTNDKKLHYSFDGGATWSSTTTRISENIEYTNCFLKLVSGQPKIRFYIHAYASGNSNTGHYWEWRPEDPKIIYEVQSPITSGTLQDIRTCEDGATYYTTDSKAYRYEEATGTLTQCNIKVYQVTYIYGRYYALTVRYGGGSALYVSDDGITFSKSSSSELRNKRIYHILKSNGKLCFAAERCAGVIYEDNTFEETAFDSTIAEYYGSPIATNKFHKL